MCLVVIALFAPRTLLFFIWLLTNWCNQAFEGWFWPFMGWLFMPFTTLAYLTAMLNNNHSVGGNWIILLVGAIIFDLLAAIGSFSDR